MEREGNLDVLPMFKEAVGVVLEVRQSSWNCNTFVCICDSVDRGGSPMTEGLAVQIPLLQSFVVCLGKTLRPKMTPNGVCRPCMAAAPIRV